ncbi:hypothetical protein PG984_013838 [Apiospora sp. TS-2023a]
MVSGRQQRLSQHQHQHGHVNNVPNLPSSHRPFLPTPTSTASLDLSSSVLATIRGDPILIEKAVRQLQQGYVYASFEKVHEDTQKLLGLIQQTWDGGRAPQLPSDRDLAALTFIAQGLVNKLQSIRNYRNSTLSRRTRRGHRAQSSEQCDHYRHPDGTRGVSRRHSKPSAPGTHSPCDDCNRTKTPEWRAGPTGPEALCNVCGLLYAKRMLRMQNRK